MLLSTAGCSGFISTAAQWIVSGFLSFPCHAESLFGFPLTFLIVLGAEEMARLESSDRCSGMSAFPLQAHPAGLPNQQERDVCSKTQSRVLFCSRLCCPFEDWALWCDSILFPKTKHDHLAERLPCGSQEWDYRSERPHTDQMEAKELRNCHHDMIFSCCSLSKATKSITIFTSHCALAGSLPAAQQQQSRELGDCLYLFPSPILSFHVVSWDSSVYFMYFWHFKAAHWQLP